MSFCGWIKEAIKTINEKGDNAVSPISLQRENPDIQHEGYPQLNDILVALRKDMLILQQKMAATEMHVYNYNSETE